MSRLPRRRARGRVVLALFIAMGSGCSTPPTAAALPPIAGRYQITLEGADAQQGLAALGVADLRGAPEALTGTLVIRGACGTPRAPRDCHWPLVGAQGADGWIELQTPDAALQWGLRRTGALELLGTWTSTVQGVRWTGQSRWSPIR